MMLHGEPQFTRQIFRLSSIRWRSSPVAWALLHRYNSGVQPDAEVTFVSKLKGLSRRR